MVTKVAELQRGEIVRHFSFIATVGTIHATRPKAAVPCELWYFMVMEYTKVLCRIFSIKRKQTFEGSPPEFAIVLGFGVEGFGLRIQGFLVRIQGLGLRV